jgi:ketosteroid isomerase-like protein
MSQENVQLIRSLYGAFARGDISAVLAALDPGIVWNEAENFLYADGNPYVGPDAVLNGVLARLGAEWEGFAAVPQEILDAGDTVVSLGRYTGTCKATGAKVDAQYVHVFRIRAGKIAGFQQYTDTAQFREAASRRAAG